MLAGCSFIGVRSDRGVVFLVAAAGCVFILCALAEVIFPSSKEGGLLHCLGISAVQGGLLGVGAWIVLMLLISVFTDTGDKFPLVIAVFAPGALAVGAVAGGVVSTVRYAARRQM